MRVTGRAKSVIDIYNGYVGAAAVQHGEKCGEPSQPGAISGAGGHGNDRRRYEAIPSDAAPGYQMVERPSTITRCLNLMVISKSLERVADHAANVAEEVVYLYEARDIRHSAHTTAAAAAN